LLSIVLEAVFESPAALALARLALAALTGLAAALLVGRWFIPIQIRLQFLERSDKGDSARLNDLHRSKKNTPTMGGVIFILGTTIATLLWADPRNPHVVLLLLTLVGLGALGFVDDYVKLAFEERKGITARRKLLFQLAIGAAAGLALYFAPPGGDAELGRSLIVPFLKLALPLGLAYVLLVGLAVAGASNAVNLTDGLDGLAMGCTVLAALPLSLAALVGGIPETAARFDAPFLPHGVEVAVFAAALLGAGLGFLWFNRHPAKIFMGDTGALALGGALGLVAVLAKKEIFFLVVGGVFVAEALSVVLQVASFKLRRKRLFLIAPLHHHFQFKGWAETQVTSSFWTAGAILAAISLATLKHW
jgi:phospho-N-acetylmuramoyl-pentapeptide-transferase